MTNQEKSTKIQAHSTSLDQKSSVLMKLLLGVPHHIIRCYPEVKGRVQLLVTLMLIQALLFVSGGALIFIQVFTDTWYNYIFGAIFGFACSWIVRFGLLTRRPSPGHEIRGVKFTSFAVTLLLFVLLVIPVALGLSGKIYSDKIEQIRVENIRSNIQAFADAQHIESDPEIRSLIKRKEYLLSVMQRAQGRDSIVQNQLILLDSAMLKATDVANEEFRLHRTRYENSLREAHFPVKEWAWQTQTDLFLGLVIGLCVLFGFISFLHFRLVVKKESIVSRHLRQHERLVIQMYHRATEEQLRSFLEAKFDVVLQRPPLHENAPFGIYPLSSKSALRRKNFSSWN